MPVRYSPLCDTNPSLYLAYLVSCYRDGERAGVDYRSSGGISVGASGRGGVDDGRGFDVAYRIACSTAGVEPCAVGVVGSVVDAGNGAVGNVGGSAGNTTGEPVGASGSADSGDVCSLVGGSGLSGMERVNSCVGGPSAMVSLRGPNYERNRRNRENKKRKKKWGCKIPFYEGTDPTRVEELREMRARSLLAEERRRTLKAESLANQLEHALEVKRVAGRGLCAANESAITPLSTRVSLSSAGSSSVSRRAVQRKSEVACCTDILDDLRGVDIPAQRKSEIVRLVLARKREASVIDV